MLWHGGVAFCAGATRRLISCQDQDAPLTLRLPGGKGAGPMKALFAAAIALASLLMRVGGPPFAQTARARLDPPVTGQIPAATAAPSPAPAAPSTPAGANYDEARVPAYTLPDPLVLLNGKKVTDARTWTRKRRPEILKLFETHVYGRAPVGRPREMTWEVAPADRDAMGGKAITKTVTLYFTGKTRIIHQMPETGAVCDVALPKRGRTFRLPGVQ
jgi:hypothetical protein